MGFGSSYQQHELPFEAPAVIHELTPGPGTYEEYDPNSSVIVGHGSRFKDTRAGSAVVRLTGTTRRRLPWT